MIGFVVGLLAGGFVGFFIAALCVAAGRSEGISYRDNGELDALLVERGDSDD